MVERRHGEPTIPKFRLDAITDGVFAFAMTLLVLDLRLPDNFDPHSSSDLLGALLDLQSQYTAYVISFFVLSLRWLGQVGERGVPEKVSYGYGVWVLIYLFFITSIPFTTMVLGRYGQYPEATWLYGANMILSVLCSIRLSYLAEEERGDEAHRDRPELATLIVSAVLSIVLSFFVPAYATLAYLINVWPALARLGRLRRISGRGRIDRPE
jgi:uncharacterized membrane protein